MFSTCSGRVKSKHRCKGRASLPENSLGWGHFFLFLRLAAPSSLACGCLTLISTSVISGLLFAVLLCLLTWHSFHRNISQIGQGVPPLHYDIILINYICNAYISKKKGHILRFSGFQQIFLWGHMSTHHYLQKAATF